MTKYIASGNRVTLRKIEQEQETTLGGLIVPAGNKGATPMGVVLSVGGDVQRDWIKEGATVVFKSVDGIIKEAGNDVLVVHLDDIVAILKG